MLIEMQAVGDVERREAADVDEVRHMAEPHAVDEVADGAAELHPERDAYRGRGPSAGRRSTGRWRRARRST